MKIKVVTMQKCITFHFWIEKKDMHTKEFWLACDDLKFWWGGRYIYMDGFLAIFRCQFNPTIRGLWN